MNIEKISTLVGIVVIVGGGFAAFAQMQEKTVQVENTVEEVKTDAEKIREKIHEEEKINVQQSILIEQSYKLLEKLDAKLDKDLKE